jgi:hypothetical protein
MQKKIIKIIFGFLWLGFSCGTLLSMQVGMYSAVNHSAPSTVNRTATIIKKIQKKISSFVSFFSRTRESREETPLVAVDPVYYVDSVNYCALEAGKNHVIKKREVMQRSSKTLVIALRGGCLGR